MNANLIFLLEISIIRDLFFPMLYNISFKLHINNTYSVIINGKSINYFVNYRQSDKDISFYKILDSFYDVLIVTSSKHSFKTEFLNFFYKKYKNGNS